MHSNLELGMFFLEEATSSSLSNKTISLLMFTPIVYVPVRSEIGWEKSQILV